MITVASYRAVEGPTILYYQGKAFSGGFPETPVEKKQRSFPRIESIFSRLERNAARLRFARESHSTPCWNCQANPCLHGKPVPDPIRVGLRVMPEHDRCFSFKRGNTRSGQSGIMKSEDYAEFGTSGGNLGPCSQREMLCYSCE